MKRIKKIAVVLLLIITSVFSFGCHRWVEKTVNPNGFLCEETLKATYVSNLPQLPHGENTYTSARFFYTNLSNEEYTKYIEEVFAYLLNQDFKHFGYQGEMISSFFGGAPKTYVFKESNDLAEYYECNEYNENLIICYYTFIWAKEVDVTTNELVSPIVFTIEYRSTPIEEYKSGYLYNIKLGFIYGVYLDSSYKLIEH